MPSHRGGEPGASGRKALSTYHELPPDGLGAAAWARLSRVKAAAAAGLDHAVNFCHDAVKPIVREVDPERQAHKPSRRLTCDRQISHGPPHATSGRGLM